uniref:DRBM domain-containing protein n=1 Tax=Panagrellus redivivus TaxID=6233 RepID=A0A7E4V499_PANRE
MDEEETDMAISLCFEPHDQHVYRDMPNIWTDTPNLQPPPPKMNDDQYRAYFESHKNDSPYTLVKNRYFRADLDNMPKEKYQKEPGTNLWICRLHDEKKDIYVGTAYHQKTAANLAATDLLDNAIEWGQNELFYIPRNKYEAKHYVDVKRKALLKMAEESKNPNPINLINEYAQFYNVNIETKENDEGPPFTSTIEFDGETYVGEAGTTKKEARRSTAGIVYDKLAESDKYFRYKQEQEVARIQNKLKKSKRRADKKKAGGSSDNKGVADEAEIG